eukprot:476625_1
MTSTTIEKNSKRKKRTIKNSLVNIDDVTVEPGCNYINWFPLVKTKLKERATEILKIRFQIIEQTIISSIGQFTLDNSEIFNKQRAPLIQMQVGQFASENYKAYYNVINKTKCSIKNTYTKITTQQLTFWKGYKPNNAHAKSIKSTTDTLITFREYFKSGRGWWDTRKMGIITHNIFIPICHMINQFAAKAAGEFFANLFVRLQKLYETYLYSLILINLVEQTMKLPNTRKLFLFPSQCYAMVTLNNFDEIQYRCHYKRLMIASKKTRTNQCSNVRNNILKLLKQQYNISKVTFQSELLYLHCEVDNYKLEQNVGMCHNKCTCKERFISIANPETILEKNKYKNHHNIDYKSKAIRYHPYNM